MILGSRSAAIPAGMDVLEILDLASDIVLALAKSLLQAPQQFVFLAFGER